jgi:selenocysteine lyase/cysteine desulfurase
MAIASMRLAQKWGPARIQAYCDALFRNPLEEIAELGFTVEPPDGRSTHIFGLHVPEGVGLGALNESLKARQVFASLRGSALRVSPHVYNDEEDVKALLDALRTVIAPGAARM